MEWIEVTGRTVEDAKELALDRLGVVEDELEFEILDEPRTGFLGRIGRSEARIRARVKPISREKPGDRRRRRPRQSKTRREPAGVPANGETKETTPTRSGAAKGSSSGRAEGENPNGAERANAASGSAGGGSSRSRRRRRGGSGRGPARSGATAVAASGEQAAVLEEESIVENDVPVEEQAAAAADFTKGLIEAFGVPARVVTEVRDDAVHVEIEGDGLGLLVGPHGATLAALEEVIRAVVQRSTGGHSARVHVDVGGYRQRRREALADFARGVAEQVKAEGVERSLEPMPPPDRKVVHDTVAEIDGVATTSQGEEPRRRVVIRPA
jgi:spoIIIJ-associated protein